MKNEKYGIELTADTSYFKKGLKEATQYIKAFGKGVKESFSEQVERAFKEDFVFNDRDFSKRIDYIQDKMDAVMDQINAIKLGGEEGDLEPLEKEYDRLKNKLEILLGYQKQFNGELEETNNISLKSKSSLSSLFDNSIGKIKRFTFYLLGARSVFSLFMRYRSIYNQYNEEMQYQSELSQNAIALSLAPAFEFLGNAIAYASIGFAKFIELLTGINVLQKVTTKGIRDYNKSLKETQTLVSGVDEITNLTNPQNLGLASQYQALAEFQKKIAEVEQFFKENKWIEDLANGLKKLWGYFKIGYDYIKEHWDVFKYLFGAVAITIIGSSTLGKLALFTAGTITLVGWLAKLTSANDDASKATDRLRNSEKKLKDLRDEKQDAEEKYIQAIDNQKEALNELTEQQNKTGQSGKELYEKIQSGELIYSNLSDELQSLYKAYRNYILATDEATKSELKFKDKTVQVNAELTKQDGLIMETTKKYTDSFTKLINKYRDGQIEAKEFTASIVSYMEGMSSSYRQTFINDLPDDVKYAFEITRQELNGTGDVIQVFKDGTELSFKSISNTIDEAFKDRNMSLNYNINADVSNAEKTIKNFFKKLGINTSNGETLVASVASLYESAKTSVKNSLTSTLKKALGFAKGLDYVPYDNFPALLHKGEAVVPAKYNPAIHSEGNDYTNSLLETLIYKVEDLASRPNVFEIDGQQFAQATYGLYDDERKRQGYVEGVVR